MSSYKKSPFITVDSFDNLKRYFDFQNDYEIIEDDLEKVRFIEDINQRRLFDATVLSLVAANVKSGKLLDIGTYLGHSAARMAVNSPKSKVYTVNIHPDELKEGGELVTGAPKVEDIGSFYREKNLGNVEQIFANTANWEVPEEISELSLVYIDGCHDREFVVNDTKLIIDRVLPGGFILWHDCSPVYRSNFHWINESMSGIEDLVLDGVISGYVLNVKYSWVGVWQKSK